MNGRGPFDYTKISTDLPNQPVVNLVQSLRRHTIIYVTGRPESSRTDTKEWLDRNVGIRGDLLMRADEDQRRDAIVKREIFDTSIRNHYNVLWVVDDRNQVVRMWRELGLTVLQVADGAF